MHHRTQRSQPHHSHNARPGHGPIQDDRTRRQRSRTMDHSRAQSSATAAAIANRALRILSHPTVRCLRFLLISALLSCRLAFVSSPFTPSFLSVHTRFSQRPTRSVAPASSSSFITVYRFALCHARLGLCRVRIGTLRPSTMYFFLTLERLALGQLQYIDVRASTS